MAIRFEDIKEHIGSRVIWGDRTELFTPEAAQAIRAKVEERTVLVFPKFTSRTKSSSPSRRPWARRCV
ncbi:hypothetical protein ACFSHP_07285 [Novosphingobium panipatense]